MARELRAAGNIQEAEKVYKRFALNEKRHIPVTNPQAAKGLKSLIMDKYVLCM